MPGVGVVTDSACDLPAELAGRYGISIVPLTIRFGEEALLDRVELASEEFWRRCKETDRLPETAAPAPGAFQRAYEEAAERGHEGVVCLTISASLSATYQAAVAGAEAVTSRIAVRVVDTRSVTLGEGLLCLCAAELAAGGARLDDIVTQLGNLVTRTHVYGVVDTLDHLQRGGRIGGAQALLGSLLSIKPVVQVKDGTVEPESRQRTRARSLEYLVAKTRSDAPLERLAVVHGAAKDLDVVLTQLKDVEVAHELVVSDLGPVVGTHTGPGSVGICYVLADR